MDNQAYFFDWSTPIEHLPDLLQGALVTLGLAVLIFAIQLVGGAFLGYLRYRKKPKVLYRIITVYVEIMRNTPLLVQIFLIYFGLPQIKIYLNNYVAGILALALNGCAYTCEVFRAGIQSIDEGQWEAGKCIGLSRTRIFLDIISPQAMRNIFPALINQFVGAMYMTTLLSSLDVRELVDVTTIVATTTFRTFEMYTFSIVIFYVLSTVTTFILRRINVKFFPSISSKGE